MNKALLWLSTCVLLLVPISDAWAQKPNPPIVTIHTSIGQQYAATYDGSIFQTAGCPAPSYINGLYAWGGADYIRRGDFDGDGTLDIASLDGPRIWIKTTKGSNDNCVASLSAFGVSPEWGGAAYTWVGDFNGDRKDDIASAYGGAVRMKLSRPGFNSFAGFISETWNVQNNWAQPGWVFVGDFTGDGRADIASASGFTVNMKLSRSFGGFQDAPWGNDGNWGGSEYARVGDFNGDGLADIASPNAALSTVHMKLSTGGGFSSTRWDGSNLWGGAGYTWVADFNGDGRDDIATAVGGTIRVRVSQAYYFSEQDSLVTNDWGSASYTWILDYDGDGDKDIVTANGLNIFVKMNLGNAFFIDSAPSTLGGYWAAPQFTWALDRSRY